MKVSKRGRWGGNDASAFKRRRARTNTGPYSLESSHSSLSGTDARFEGLGQFGRRRKTRKNETHLNLADGEGEGTVAVVILDDLELVLLADVEHRGGLFVFGGGRVGSEGRVGSVTAGPGPRGWRKSIARVVRFIHACRPRKRRVGRSVGAATAGARRRRDDRREAGTASVATSPSFARARRKSESRFRVLTLRTSAREDSEAGQRAAALAPMSTHAPLESQWNTLPETRSPTLYENS